MFKRILVATDLTKASERAFAVGVQLAREHGAALWIVHVVKDPATEPWALEAYGVDFGALTREGLAAAKRALAAHVERIIPPLQAVSAEVVLGNAVDEIVRYANEAKVDLIVVGSHGRGPVQRAFLGSVADRVLRLAICPVLLVRPATATAGTLEDAA